MISETVSGGSSRRKRKTDLRHEQKFQTRPITFLVNGPMKPVILMELLTTVAMLGFR